MYQIYMARAHTCSTQATWAIYYSYPDTSKRRTKPGSHADSVIELQMVFPSTLVVWNLSEPAHRKRTFRGWID